MMQLPDFENLPNVAGFADKCAWGLFDKGEEKDRLGTLNLLTPDVVIAASKEIRSGKCISLKYGPQFKKDLFNLIGEPKLACRCS